MAAAQKGIPESGNRDRDAVALRRKALGDTEGKPWLATDAPVIGLALSGGGIRSATFCLGLLRALAKNGVLHRFDYLSTVSGGGYIGAMLGRLFHPDPCGNARDVEAGLAEDRSLLLWWLRNNGRYLLPSGGKDLLQAFSGQFRSFVATQFEVMVVCMFLACAVVLPHVAYSWWLGARAVPLLGVTMWWWLLPLPAMAALMAGYGYWMLGATWRTGLGLCLLATAIGGYLFYLGFLSPAPLSVALLWLARIAALAILPVVPAWLVTILSSRRRPQDSNRVVYTKALAAAFAAAGLFFVLGCLDLGGWMLRGVFLSVLHGEWRFAVPWGIGTTSLLVIAARAIAPLLSSKDRVALDGLPLEALGNALGLVLVALVAVFWLGVFEMILLPSDDRWSLGVPAAYLYLPVVVTAGVVFLLLTGNEFQQLNRSSLHFFYRSRLARSYLAVGNYAGAHGGASGRFPVCPLALNDRALSGSTQRATELLPGDDVSLDAYHPHAAGGPVHLINCCINQTVDDRTGLFNADRKGVSLTIGPLGVETGTQPPRPSPFLARTTLAEWIAISGAAVGSGMGSLTRPGVAVMTFLSGFRLGYWQRSLINRNASSRLGLAKYRALLQEMFARFPGLGAHYWYLSDGGHFDNTGVYALLKRRLPLIVLADCGTDPQYRFGDLENLARKARIDHDALIEFVEPSSLRALAGPLAEAFGTPASIASGRGDPYLLLARIRYADGAKGALLMVKPRVVANLGIDITGYADRNADFPQQSTINQFFSEEEWEAYCALGLALGRPLDAPLLDAATQWAWQAQVAPMPAAVDPPQDPTPVKAPRRIAATVGTSLGAGALLTGLLAGWQAWNDYQRQAEAGEAQFASAVRDAEEGLGTATKFTPNLKVRLDMLLSYADRHHLSPDQQATLFEIAEQVRPLCNHSDSESLKNDCNNDVARWGGGRVDLPGYWSQSIASYANWPTRRPPVPGQFAATEAPAPAPPPPPAPVTEPGMSSATSQAPPLASDGLVTASAAPPRTRWPQTPPIAAGAAPTVTALGVTHACARGDGHPFTLYTQIYDERQRDFAMQLLSTLRPLGIVVPGVENVTATAVREQRKPPIPWSRPTLLYGTEGKPCAEALASWIGYSAGPMQALPLPSSMAASGGVIELWLPPSVGGAGAPVAGNP